MESEIKELNPSDFKDKGLGLLHEIPDPPKQLWYQGQMPPRELKLLAVVGSRKYTTYGKQVVEHLISGLAGYPVGIVSGLALGIDGLAHEAALKNNLYTLAVPGSGLDEKVLYPASHKSLARRIVEGGGGLMSELPPTTASAPWTFPQRNRLMAGLAHATILIEARAKSGTLITARMAVDYNRELLAVPGSIFSKNSHGTHQFLKLGATMVTDASDILLALNIEEKKAEQKARPKLSELEEKVIKLLHEPLDRDTLIRQLNIPVAEAGILLMNMEMQGYVKCEMSYYHCTI
ncbi:MAG: DNA-protecting protein DprA [Candidatus Nomurabacteria bacterium]|nr:DNA-protecting protein DprA [Candidatus Nomurabacteria bacterium]USN87710.1 MAG: DNA-protecting protein DprA [Candidatus Nomurabacteria bacterium]